MQRSEKLQASCYFIFAGEKSADIYGASLIEQLRKKDPHSTFFGVGGPLMRQNGIELIIPMEEFSVMGFSDVLKALPRLIINFYKLKKTILQKAPNAAIFI